MANFISELNKYIEDYLYYYSDDVLNDYIDTHPWHLAPIDRYHLLNNHS